MVSPPASPLDRRIQPYPRLATTDQIPSSGKALEPYPENDLNALDSDFNTKAQMSSTESGGYKVMYQSPGDTHARYYPDPPPPTHGWKKFTYDGKAKKVNMVSHSPKRGQDRTQRRASRTRSYAEDHSDSRLTSDGYKVLYLAPGETHARYYPDPPPPTHGWKRCTYDGEKAHVTSHSPKRGRERTRRPASRTPSYANDEYDDWRQPQENNNSRHHEKKTRHSSHAYNPDPTSSPRPQNTLPDHYATLRVSPFATPDEIRKAAKIRRIQVHPDTMRRKAALQGRRLDEGDEEGIERVAKEVGEAAEVLGGRESRRVYDGEREAEAEAEAEE